MASSNFATYIDTRAYFREWPPIVGWFTWLQLAQLLACPLSRGLGKFLQISKRRATPVDGLIHQGRSVSNFIQQAKGGV